jgi:hypothetical protein
MIKYIPTPILVLSKGLIFRIFIALVVAYLAFLDPIVAVLVSIAYTLSIYELQNRIKVNQNQLQVLNVINQQSQQHNRNSHSLETQIKLQEQFTQQVYQDSTIPEPLTEDLSDENLEKSDAYTLISQQILVPNSNPCVGTSVFSNINDTQGLNQLPIGYSSNQKSITC